MLLRPAPGERRRTGRWASVPAALLIAAVVAGCSLRQAYDSVQGWQRNACSRVVDAIERERCVASTTTSYDDYRRQRNRPDDAAN
jgi:hypothetical protein